MIVKPALAAMVASGLIVPEAPKLVFPKPAIVKPENLDLSKHMLLGMPLTMGMLPGKGVADPYYIGNASGATSASATSISWSHTTTSDTTCLVVAAWAGDNGTGVSISSVTFNGTGLTLVRQTTAASHGRASLWYLFDPPVGTYTINVTGASLASRGIDGSAANFGNANAVNISGQTNQTTTNPITTTITSTKKGMAVGQTHTNIVGTSTISNTFNSPTGLTAIRTNSYNSNRNRKHSVFTYSPTLVNAGSSTLSVRSSVTPAGQQQVYMILSSS